MKSLKTNAFTQISRVQDKCREEILFYDQLCPYSLGAMVYAKSWGSFHFTPESDLKLSPKKEYFLWFIINGNFLFVKDDKTRKLQPGDILIVRSGERHKSFSLFESESGCARFIRIVPGFTANAFFEHDAFADKEIFRSPLFFKYLELIDRMEAMKTEEIRRGTADEEIRRLISCRTYELLTLLFSSVGSLHDHRDKISEITAFILENISSNLRLEDIEKKFHIERHTLNRLVARQRNTTPIKLFRIHKLEYTSRLLKSTSLPITEIARSCGFSSPVVYSRLFRSYYGLSPMQYREKYSFNQLLQQYYNRETVAKKHKRSMQEKILSLVGKDPRIIRKKLASQTGLTLRGVDWNLRSLRKQGLLIRLGSPRKGKWQPVAEFRM